MVKVENTHLLEYLRKGDAIYYGEVLKLRDKITGLLEYIPHLSQTILGTL